MILQQKPTGFMRLWFRSPIVLYRLGLGRLGGHQFLLLTHRGRRTGLLHQTVLKTLRYDRATGEAIVMAPLGDRADWMRNIRHSQPLEVQIGSRRYVPTYRVLEEDETIRFLDALRRAHPVWTAIGIRALGLKSGQWTGVTLVSFQPAQHAALPNSGASSAPADSVTSLARADAARQEQGVRS
jgi:deazaflavin-dependent oxidoreductase (nitroreductase family)